MREILEQFAALDEGTRASIMAAVAGGIVWVLRAAGMKSWPGLLSVLTAALLGAAAGAVTLGWQGALLGAIAGLASVGVNQGKRQADKYEADRETLIEGGE